MDHNLLFEYGGLVYVVFIWPLYGINMDFIWLPTRLIIGRLFGKVKNLRPSKHSEYVSMPLLFGTKMEHWNIIYCTWMSYLDDTPIRHHSVQYI